MSSTLSLDFQYTTSIERLWTALTDSSKLAKWVVNIHTGQAMENDFMPVVGHHFQFRTQPTEWWDGIVNGEVLIVDEPNRLSYTWVSGGEKHTITWTLKDLGNGKVSLHLEQTGISNAQALSGARYGWTNWCNKLEKVLEK
ncbi:SRPBCC domain-containing protein [Halalkalibacterium halodurans]|uniref:SRPBCC family protein n=1 Tax=Halalkalibacterium halodurans TaxID=86665 RepID=UPI002AA9A520|nr:SRPBCC domain-containing protein [Halalkalibacterium halodurans]MDY7222639.1 SRPBCC domain-containing protein [Halalkalibacterium halodurans]MDY7241860.1 SRPBCC domain-containing protein [Halalkalibacterium halodurans]MED4082462.1 SRPBCC domain-containing protein [Halalkalibacterium halodurans]MED4085033.1 SRPBCC domain-containing protein [Halalkalibacterium halodurans]MED4107101.1 SRPBCC domain-containing protein [Halalkalibacterium halodurans]